MRIARLKRLLSDRDGHRRHKPGERRVMTGAGAGQGTSPTDVICVVGPGTRFMSGISVYTVRLANALAEKRPVIVVTMRQLLPSRLYPGRTRIGAALSDLELDRRVTLFDGVDWYWIPSLVKAWLFLIRERPSVVIFQWWSGTVLHTYLALALLLRFMGARVVVEFHEVLDTAEARIPLAHTYVRLAAPILFGLASGFAVHSAYDRDLVVRKYRLSSKPVVVVPHGPYDHYGSPPEERSPIHQREAPPDVCNLTFFGVIRPYKGLEDLVTAFDSIDPTEIASYWLTVVGETWEGWDLPARLIEASRYRERITFINRYVTDDELDACMRGADAVVLPYRRSSLSGPLHVAMAYGLPVVITDVGGNPEVTQRYGGAVVVAPGDPPALRDGLIRASKMKGERFRPPTDWADAVSEYERLLSKPRSK